MGSRLEFLDPFWYKDCPSCFPLGRDSLELGRFAAVKPGWRVCDLGCGGGVLLLLLAGRAEKLELTGVELDGPSAQAARENLARNGLSGTVRRGALIWWCPTHPISPSAPDAPAAGPGWRSAARWRSCAKQRGGC